MSYQPRAKRVAIIGGGPSGAISLNTLVQEDVFESIVLFERKDGFGGTWRNDLSNDGKSVKPGLNEKESDLIIEIPESVKTSSPGEKLTLNKTASDQIRWIGSPALYPSLRTNVPERIMAFSDDKKFPFLDKAEQDELTKRESIEQYVVNYINNNVKSNVELKTNTSVEKIYKQDGVFHIIWKHVTGDDVEEWGHDIFEAVIIATGHYNVPRIPNVPGIQQVYSKFPTKIIHSKGFIPDESFRNKKIIVIGSRSSSVDTVRELKPFTNDITWSVRLTNTQFNAHKDVGIKRTLRKPIIKEYKLVNDQLIVVFEDGSELENPDYIIYATGYHFSFPFLNEQYPDITNNGLIINNLYQHTFLISDPLLSFIGTPIDGMSFRVFEIQAILNARYLAGKVTLPSLKDQKQWHEERLEKYGVTRYFHSTINDPALTYIDNLVQLGGGYDKIGTKGKEFPKFSELDLQVYEKNKETLTNRWSLL